MGEVDAYKLLELLKDTFAEEIAHLELRLIRDAQAPRFESIKDEHPEIWDDFVRARTGPHEVLLEARRRRIRVLTQLIEDNNCPPGNGGPAHDCELG